MGKCWRWVTWDKASRRTADGGRRTGYAKSKIFSCGKESGSPTGQRNSIPAHPSEGCALESPTVHDARRTTGASSPSHILPDGGNREDCALSDHLCLIRQFGVPTPHVPEWQSVVFAHDREHLLALVDPRPLLFQKTRPPAGRGHYALISFPQFPIAVFSIPVVLFDDVVVRGRRMVREGTLRARSNPSQVLEHLGAPPIRPTEESPQSCSTSQR